MSAEQEEQPELINMPLGNPVYKSGYKPITVNTSIGRATISRPKLRKQLYELRILPKCNSSVLKELFVILRPPKGPKNLFLDPSLAFGSFRMTN